MSSSLAMKEKPNNSVRSKLSLHCDKTKNTSENYPESRSTFHEFGHLGSLTKNKSFCSCDGTCPRCLKNKNNEDNRTSIFTPTIQTKLNISEPEDTYELEADKVAERVMRTSFLKLSNHEQNESIDGKYLDDVMNKKRQGILNISRELSPTSNLEPIHGVANEINRVISSPGSPLDTSMREFMESRFEYNFSNVRVHTDERSAESAERVNAEAYTLRNHIVFGRDMFAPHSYEGRKLIAHELTHVVQQSNELNPKRIDLGTRVTRKENNYVEESPHVSTGILTQDPSQLTNSKMIVTHKSNNTLRLSQPSIFAHNPSIYSGRGSTKILPTLRYSDHLDTKDALIQRRRVPGPPELSAALPLAGPGLTKGRTGLARVLSRAWAGLSSTTQATVRTAASAAIGLTWIGEEDLLIKLDSASRADLISFANEIRIAEPNAQLASPLLIDMGARPGTSDAANISTLVTGAGSVFTTIAGVARDSDLVQVFGAGNVAAAKSKYANANSKMITLKASDKIVTDRSGYSSEVSLGGLSNSAQISVDPSTIDHPTLNESVVMIIHESMHAGNNDVHDFGYITQPSFTALSAATKLTNAAHYEVVPRRILGAPFSFPGTVFIPAGTAVGGVAAPVLTPTQQAIRGASERFRSAWTAALNLHRLFVRLFRAPTDWAILDLPTEYGGAAAGSHFSNTLLYWSKVEMLTMHTRAPSINPAGAPPVKPVTLIDISLSEGLIRKLAQGMDNVPPTEIDANSFKTSNATPAELAAASVSVAAQLDLLIKLVIRVTLGSITGTVSRDERVVKRLASAGLIHDFSDLLGIRAAGAFP